MAEVRVPELAESITEGTIAEWLKQPGDTVSKGDYILELETDKVNVELISEYDGVLQEITKEAGDTVNVGEVVAIIAEGATSTEAPEAPAPKEAALEPKAEAPAKAASAPEKENSAAGNVIATPAARKMARERGIDLSQVATSDPMGRVNKQDVAQYEPKQQHPAKAAAPVQQTEDNRIEKVKMSRRRQTIAKRLVDVQHTAAMLTTFNEVDMSAIMDLRNRRKEAFQKSNDVKLGFMSFFTKAVVGALKKYPLLNAEIQGDQLLIKKFYDIGIAVAAPDGLVVPVVRDADKLGFAGIEKEIGTLAAKARDNKLGLSELQGGTFTITNGGTFGSLMSTPILNAPQVGILGMHKTQYRPIAIDENTMEIRPMMYIALSYDHRIVDGKEAVSFLVKVKQLLEDPEQLLLES